MRVHGGAVLAGMWRVGFIEERRKNCLPLLHVQGKEKGEQCRSKRHYSAFFFKHETTLFYTKRTVSFKGGTNICFPNQSLIYPFVLLSPHNVILILRINSIASLLISVSTPIVGRAFHFSPWPLIYAIGPPIDQ
jgi:hypothetical protein